jgi:hypothetical protein
MFYVKRGRVITHFQHVEFAIAYWRVTLGSVILVKKNGRLVNLF